MFTIMWMGGKSMGRIKIVLLFLLVGPLATYVWAAETPLGLPPVPIPSDNLQTPGKIALGKLLFEDKRFSGDGTVSCATCHDPQKAFADRLPTSEGIKKLKGTRNAPTVVNAVYYDSQFWDGRRPSLEEQSKDPLINPIEHGLPSHAPILEIIRKDGSYPSQFQSVFGVVPQQITIDHVAKAIASFERTVVSGDSPFDRYLYGGDKTALSESAIRGLEIYRTKGRCQDCHAIGQTNATFTDNKFHNLGVGFKRLGARAVQIANAFRKAKQEGKDIDKAVLGDQEVSELGRFVVTLRPSDIGAFKTPTLRNIAATAPYMHDGSIQTLEEVIELYDKGGESNPFLDSGIRPLNLTAQEKVDLLAFMKSLTSPQFANIVQSTRKE
jgi:cytochrome c peroxidase